MLCHFLVLQFRWCWSHEWCLEEFIPFQLFGWFKKKTGTSSVKFSREAIQPQSSSYWYCLQYWFNCISMSLCPNFGMYDDSIYFCGITCSISFASLVLVIWAFYFLNNWDKDLAILFFSKHQLFLWLIFCIIFKCHSICFFLKKIFLFKGRFLKRAEASMWVF